MDAKEEGDLLPNNSEKRVYPKKYEIIIFILFFILGLINNLGYVLILSCSSRFAGDLGNANLVALYPLYVN